MVYHELTTLRRVYFARTAIKIERYYVGCGKNTREPTRETSCLINILLGLGARGDKNGCCDAEMADISRQA